MPPLYPPEIDHGDFQDPAIAQLPPPPRPRFAIRSPFNRNVANVVVQPVAAIEELKVTSNRTGKSSKTSFDDDPGATIRSTSKEKRFHFAPVVETLTVRWKLKGEAHVRRVHVYVYHRASAAPLLKVSRTYTQGLCPRTDAFTFDGSLVGLAAGGTHYTEARSNNYAGPDFPANVLTVKCSPYKLKVVIEVFGGAVRTVPARWVYLDVLLDGIDLAWGPKAALAASPVLPSNVGAGPQRDHHVYDALVDAHDATNLSGRFPAEGETKRVYLQSHRFYQQEAELTDNSSWAQHFAAWGEGPNVPIYLTPGVLRSDDVRVTGANAAPALAGLQFAWEWLDAAAPTPGDLYVPVDPPDPYAADFGAGKASALAFVDAALDFDAATTTPPGKNCHVERGGKRGPGAPRVFPAPAGPPFPFTVAHPAGGNWCAVSTVAHAGADAGKTGVLFQPSIQAGDGYKLRVAAVYDDYVDPAGAHGAFTAEMAAMPAELVAKTGTFQVWRDLDHSMTAIALPDVPRDDLSAFSKRFEKLNFRVRNHVVPSGNFFTTIEQIYSGAINTVGLLDDFVRLSLETNNATYGARAFGVYFRSWAQWKNAMIAHHGSARQAYDWAKNYTSPVRDFWRADIAQVGSHPLLEPWPANYNFHPLPVHGQIQISISGAHPLQPAQVVACQAANVGAVRAAVKAAFFNMVYDQKRYTQGTDANLTADVHCNVGDQGAVQAEVDLGMADVWDEKSKERYEYSVRYAWIYPILNVVNDQLFTARDGLRTAQFDFNKNHNLSMGPAGKALAANAQRASLDVFIFKQDGVLSTLVHEVAHALFINHPSWDANQAANDPRHLHDAATTHCTMTTPSRGHNYCGFCMLRLRGWSIYELDAARAPVPLNPLPHPVQPDMHERTLVETGANNSR